MQPTPEELAAMPMADMTYQERCAQVAGLGFDAMSPELKSAYFGAVMSALNNSAKPPTAAVPHIRQRIAYKRGNSFYAVKYSESENGSRTLCGAEAGPDFTWLEGRRLVDDESVCAACREIRRAQDAAGPRR